ncbi:MULTISPECIES: helix-turn-helix transcriptional regulator [Micromonospora]|jgi:DNA-binding NarL/FixJ family response regulator|uniref:DNA-binding response regulator, NarL/FixJ family, contains REC and HTH domains n=1 Tax=Micromonospora carbonacea TaxID=47853 RepID=A0A1C4Y9U2_9ACTN|nr:MULTISPECIES: response regulator transcription factor [Micromonospora]MBB5830183.1 DNA-binding NarL/FixJ family response regulator [Micromonospora carbonacea]MDG4815963.1 response regulator transcription factor [Micromonospora sp. WMMD956]QLD27903.1 response regulator transcription factor [Micromonospora carbonacea]WFE58489.1 response regulator transcription factor [Micromonospora sp. WMMD712]SCF17484.1 DNA-binding response regulator, NarL/FixJ family, contains REC and HTH domains [Micromon
MQRIPVYVHATDPISWTGVTGQLTGRPEVRVLAQAEAADAAVTLVVVDSLTPPVAQVLRRLRREQNRLVLVPATIDDAQLSAAVECGVVGVVRRGEASAGRLVEVILSAARGEGSVPADLLGRLLNQMRRLQREVLDPRGLSLGGLSSREVDVLRLVADGFETREIAAKLSYSERTVKNVVHGMTTRLHLRNRAHAVAYALRHDLI